MEQRPSMTPWGAAPAFPVRPSHLPPPPMMQPIQMSYGAYGLNVPGGGKGGGKGGGGKGGKGGGGKGGKGGKGGGAKGGGGGGGNAVQAFYRPSFVENPWANLLPNDPLGPPISLPPPSFRPPPVATPAAAASQLPPAAPSPSPPHAAVAPAQPPPPASHPTLAQPQQPLGQAPPATAAPQQRRAISLPPPRETAASATPELAPPASALPLPSALSSGLGSGGAPASELQQYRGMVRKLAEVLDEVKEPRLAARLLLQLQAFYATVTEARRTLAAEAAREAAREAGPEAGPAGTAGVPVALNKPQATPGPAQQHSPSQPPSKRSKLDLPPPVSSAIGGAGAGAKAAPAAAAAADEEVMIGPQRTGDWQSAGYPDAPEEPCDRPDASTWGVGELKRYLSKHSLAIAGAMEKADLVRMVLAHQQGA